MAEVDIDVGRKRRLPLWMLQVTTTDEIRTLGNKDESHTSEKEQSLSQATSQPKAKPAKRLGKQILNNNDKEALEVDSSSLVRCENRERTRKSRRRGVGPNNSITSSNEADVPMKKSRTVCGGDKRSVRKRAAPKKKKLKGCGPESSDEIETTSPTEGGEDGIDLTMEDLLSMAEECVKADKDKECQQAATTEPKSKTQLQSTSIFSKNESVGSLQAIGSIQQIPSSDLNKTRETEKFNSVSEGAMINTSRTGDPAQDMLDLFLGPLLKKPRSEDRKVELIMEDMSLACDLSKHIKSQVPVKESAPMMKKKSSLKDKVAMFLD
ncbi:uncharacterized protein LOC131243005 [Magnolia sinica]|uniref:uncharacterized protein LOC131243005 n=1 Tax=Magnolia sinica TaxID=86752 RepID=UPI00265AB0CA|nr:uncharacterized protein LOC131243005 [Magnolia sinica]